MWLREAGSHARLQKGALQRGSLPCPYLARLLALPVHLQKLVQQIIKLCTQEWGEGGPGRQSGQAYRRATSASTHMPASRLRASLAPCPAHAALPSHTCHVGKPADLLPLLLQVPNLLLIILQGQVLKPGGGGQGAGGEG